MADLGAGRGFPASCRGRSARTRRSTSAESPSASARAIDRLDSAQRDGERPAPSRARARNGRVPASAVGPGATTWSPPRPGLAGAPQRSTRRRCCARRGSRRLEGERDPDEEGAGAGAAAALGMGSRRCTRWSVRGARHRHLHVIRKVRHAADSAAPRDGPQAPHWTDGPGAFLRSTVRVQPSAATRFRPEAESRRLHGKRGGGRQPEGRSRQDDHGREPRSERRRRGDSTLLWTSIRSATPPSRSEREGSHPNVYGHRLGPSLHRSRRPRPQAPSGSTSSPSSLGSSRGVRGAAVHRRVGDTPAPSGSARCASADLLTLGRLPALAPLT